jgi:hypothetical protein
MAPGEERHQKTASKMRGKNAACRIFAHQRKRIMLRDTQSQNLAQRRKRRKAFCGIPGG